MNDPSRDSLQDINSFLVEVLRDRLERLGEIDSGLYNFYKVRVERKEMFPAQERALMTKIVERYDTSWIVHDIGAGIGTLALGLAVLGHVSYAIERDRRRVGAMQAVTDGLTRELPEVAARFRDVHAKFPSAGVSKAFTPGRTLGIVTNFVGTLTEQEQNDFLVEFAQYPAAIMDVQRFCVNRSTEPEWISLVDRLEQLSTQPWELLSDGGTAGKFYCKSG